MLSDMIIQIMIYREFRRIDKINRLRERLTRKSNGRIMNNNKLNKKMLQKSKKEEKKKNK